MRKMKPEIGQRVQAEPPPSVAVANTGRVPSQGLTGDLGDPSPPFLPRTKSLGCPLGASCEALCGRSCWNLYPYYLYTLQKLHYCASQHADNSPSCTWQSFVLIYTCSLGDDGKMRLERTLELASSCTLLLVSIISQWSFYQRPWL